MFPFRLAQAWTRVRKKRSIRKLKVKTGTVLMLLGMLLAPALTASAEDRTAIRSRTPRRFTCRPTPIAPRCVPPPQYRASGTRRTRWMAPGGISRPTVWFAHGVRGNAARPREDAALEPTDLSVNEPAHFTQAPVATQESADQQQWQMPTDRIAQPPVAWRQPWMG